MTEILDLVVEKTIWILLLPEQVRIDTTFYQGIARLALLKYGSVHDILEEFSVYLQKSEPFFAQYT